MNRGGFMTELRHIKALELDKVLFQLSELASIKDSKEMALELKPSDVLYDAQTLINQTNAAYVLLAKFGGPSFGAAKNVNSSLSRASAGGVLTMKELLDILANDYKDNEALRQRIINRIPHFGNNEESTDKIASELSRMLVRCCEGITNYRGEKSLIPGVFSYVVHSKFGAQTGASPDGRHAGYPLSSGSSPVQGREMNGPTAALLSNTAWSHKEYLGGVAINVKFSEGQMSGENEDRMVDYIRVFLERGGYQLQFNCVDTKTLLAAQEDPEKYSDLLVRVGGFSAYFCKLPRDMQQEIIDRNAHNF